MISIRHSSERRATRLEWLDSRHTFSFGDYYDPEQRGFRSLRVINDDRVAPGAGFDAWIQVAEGVLTLNGQTLEAGDGAAVSDETLLELAGVDDAELLLFDLP